MSNIHSLVAPIRVFDPEAISSPLVIASPHSGDHYPADLIDASVLSKAALRRSEDCYVDDLFSKAKEIGAPLICARYARAYLDLNREPYELDPNMFSETLPDHFNTSSARVAAGLGTIARIVANQKEIYARKLRLSEAELRINHIYDPYHKALRRLVNRAKDQFGFCILLDCHSMPSIGLPAGGRGPEETIDIVLGDRNGLSCSALVAEETERIFGFLGYTLVRNNPYAGGYTTHHYGDPANGVHAIQIEINRSLYMDENSLNRRPGFSKLRADLGQFLDLLANFCSESRPELSYQRLSAE